MIQLRSVRLLRTKYRVPLKKVREAIELAHADYEIESPLARRFQFAWFDGVIVLKIGEDWIGATGKDKHQRFMRHVITPYLDDLSFNRQTGAAELWSPMRSQNYSIQLNPRLRFGQPVVMPGAIMAESLADAVISEGSVEAAAAEFGVTREAVDLAWQYTDSLVSNAA